MVDVVDLGYGSEAEIFVIFKGFKSENYPGFL